LPLVIMALAASAVSLYYYLQVLKRVYVSKPLQTEHSQITPMRVSAIELLILTVIAFAVVLLGILPGALSSWIPLG
jgi:NADH-quinone oxidoreductase subunit N